MFSLGYIELDTFAPTAGLQLRKNIFGSNMQELFAMIIFRFLRTVYFEVEGSGFRERLKSASWIYL